MAVPPGSGAPSTPAPPRRIRQLSERTVREIAAGEVIERPASVVKELVENSLDAGSREIQVRVAQGGLELIEVADDGGGIAEADLLLAFERHATSKLEEAVDLPMVRTLGFRGEALASIGAVAKVTLTTRPTGASEGRQVEVTAGRAERVRPAARAPGTTLEVRDLFFNTPARRKFLKSPATEGLRITEALEALYLARPDVTFRLRRDAGAEAVYPGVRSLTEAAARVFGAAFVTRSFEFSGAGGPGIWVEGAASHPSFSRGSSRGIVLAVDGRPIQSRSLQEGLRYAYRDLLPQGRYPVVVVHLRTEPGRVDVNVHPTKREVRFERESELREALNALLRGRLKDQPRGAPLSPNASRARPWLVTEPGGELRPPTSLGAPGGPTEAAVSSSSPPREQAGPWEEEGPPVPAMGGRRRPGAATEGAEPSPSELFEAGTPRVEGTKVHPTVHVLGQLGRLYLVAEAESREGGPSGTLVLVDAHAASERILYERLLSREPPARQELLISVDLELTARQRATWEAHREELAQAGFDLDPFGPSSFRLRAVPFFRGHRARPEAMLRLLDELADGGRSPPGSTLRERVARTAACHLAIRGGDELSLPQMRRLLGELYACPESFTCPHGRPIMVLLPRDRLDRWFLRP